MCVECALKSTYARVTQASQTMQGKRGVVNQVEPANVHVQHAIVQKGKEASPRDLLAC